MIPILYESGETTFTSNGLGRLPDASSCYVTEERNGKYELEMEYPIGGLHYEDLKIERIILAVPSVNTEAQPFRIYSIEPDSTGFKSKINAQHISYDLCKYVVEPFSGESAGSVLSAIPSHVIGGGCPFEFSSTKTNTANFKMDEPKSARNILGGEEGSVLDTFGTGEYEFDRYSVKFLAARGGDRGTVIRYGKNLTKATGETSTEKTYTAIVPYVKVTKTDDDGNDKDICVIGDLIYVDEKEKNSKYTHQMTKAEDVSQYWNDYLNSIEKEEDKPEAPTKEQVNNFGKQFVKVNNTINNLSDSFKVSFVDLATTEEYKDIAPLEKINLCDTVTVKYEALGIDAKAKCITTKYDVINNRYDEITIGEVSNNFVTAVSAAINDATDKLVTDDFMKASLTRAALQITGGLGGRIFIRRDKAKHPIEIVIACARSDGKQPTKYDDGSPVWRWNSGGLAFFPNGYDETLTDEDLNSDKLPNVAITRDGAINASLITTGVLRAGLIKAGVLSDKAGNFYLDTESGNLRMKNGTFEGSVTGSTVTGSTITGSTINGPSKNFWNLSTGEFFLGNPSSTYIERNGDGNMAGAFGGWEVGDKYIQSKALSNGTRFYLDSYNGQLYIGSGWGRRRETVLTDEEVRGKYMIINSSVTDLSHSPCFESITDDEGHKLLDMCAYSERGRGGDKHKYVFLDYGCLAGNFSRDGNGHGLGFYALTDWCEAVQRKFIDSGLGELDLRRMHDLG